MMSKLFAEPKEHCGSALQGRKGSHRFLVNVPPLCLSRVSQTYAISHIHVSRFEVLANLTSAHLGVRLYTSLPTAGVMCSAWLMYQGHADGENNSCTQLTASPAPEHLAYAF